MELRIAHRDRRDTTIQATDSDKDYFEIGSRYNAKYADNKIIISRTRFKNHTRGVLCAVPTSYRCEGYTRSINFSKLDRWIPAFSVNAAEFQIIGETIVWERPAVHLLPWPTKGPHTGARAAAFYGYASRLASAKRHGLPTLEVTRAIPEWARAALQTDDWLKARSSLELV